MSIFPKPICAIVRFIDHVVDWAPITCASNCLLRGDCEARIILFPLSAFNAGSCSGSGGLGGGGPLGDKGPAGPRGDGAGPVAPAPETGRCASSYEGGGPFGIESDIVG